MNMFDARNIFRQLGAGEVNATLATEWAYHKPITSEPSAVPSMAVVQLVQRGLNSVGCAVPESGKLCPLTAQCLEDVSGPEWKNITWLEHAKNIVRMKQLGRKVEHTHAAALSGSGGGGMIGSLGALISIGVLAYIMVKTK